jgi:hypothetical protein
MFLDNADTRRAARLPRRAARFYAVNRKTSYHLRKLAEQGFVEKVPEKSDGRERWWRALTFHIQAPDPAKMAAAEWSGRRDGLARAPSVEQQVSPTQGFGAARARVRSARVDYAKHPDITIKVTTSS